ncbi:MULTISPECIES: hypothetical protein [unclassified Nonomuraea]|uniref:hypothetical protein n=1 Tax=Nonomuraea sp. NPDC049725 TaxID=3154508 RepID=UPI00342D24E6
MRLFVGIGIVMALGLAGGLTAEVTAPAPARADHGPLRWTDEWTGVKIRPRRPRQDSDVRVLVRCPFEANRAIVATKPFNPPGSFKFRRELGIGIDDGRGFDTETIAFDALRGPRRVTLKCLKVTMYEHPRRRKVEVLSRSHTHIFVRRFKKGRF